MFSTGLRLALPVIAVMIMVGHLAGAAGRVNAQLHLITIAFPVKMMVGLAMLAGWSCCCPILLRGTFAGASRRPRLSWSTRPDRMAGDGGQQKDRTTDPATLQKAREEGNFPTARVFVSAFQFLTFVALLHSLGTAVAGRGLRASMAPDPAQSSGSQATAPGIARSVLRCGESRNPSPGGGGRDSDRGSPLQIQLGVTRMGVSLKKLTPDVQATESAISATESAEAKSSLVCCRPLS